MKLLTPKDFKEYFTSSTDQVVACTIANDKINEVLRRIINDPTKGSTGEFANGYRTAIKQIINDLEKE